MYPVLRMAYQVAVARKAPPLGLFDTHVSHHRCWPWDIDFWMELNNGRALTLFDLGRIPLAMRTGLVKVLKAQRWGLTIAGSAVRYRRRVRMFDRIEMHSRLVGWDHRFVYIDQVMVVDGVATSQALLRSAVTDAKGIVPPDRVAAALGVDPVSPALPDWVQAWLTAEDARPWPPQL